MSNNLECPSTCLTKDNPGLCSLAYRVEKVYFSTAFASSPHENMVTAEDAIRRGEITAEDISRLTPQLEADVDLSLNGCFVSLHEGARADKETLAALTDEGSLAVAGCATLRLQKICKQ